MIKAPISVGELIDKIIILEIKLEKIKNENACYNLFFVRDYVVGYHFYSVNDVKFLYRTPKLGHRPCGENNQHTSLMELWVINQIY